MEQDLLERFPPLPDRIGHVGGVESLTLDGRRYYFGFDYSSDLVVSPLIDDPKAMAAFASEYMRQRTGRHDAAYWADLVALAVDGTALTGDDADRVVASADLRGGLPESGGHLLYLLGAATGWEDWFEEAPEVRRAYERLGFDEDDPEFVDHCLDAVRERGRQARPDEWTVVHFHLTAAVRHLPGNWHLLFAPLAEGLPNHR
ncbi:hypothetical protein [Kitasatospora purpeofusca]|uniref:hypothetical protein n=1 Tax=Kitasatospora purpeofusca TaxID=67352 RepID=UPI00068B058E|nr:hypothetical protein [Kitasatospora purpeofusca]